MSEGLFGKYRIEKTDGTPIDQHAIYFVIRVDKGGTPERAAISAYVDWCNDEKLKNDLRKLLKDTDPHFGTDPMRGR